MINSKIKKIVCLILITVSISLLIYSCSNDSKLSEEENELFINIKNSEYGSSSPRLLCSSDEYVAILHTEGLMLYDIVEDKLKGLVDVKSEGFNNLQGYDLTKAYYNDKEIVLMNLDDDSRYLKIDLDLNEKELIYDIDRDNYNEIEYSGINNDQLKLVSNILLGEVVAANTDNNLIIFTNDYKAENKDWRIIVLDKYDLEKEKIIKIFK